MSAAAATNYPLVVKGKYYDATVCQTLEQAPKAFHKLEEPNGVFLLLHEFIHGTEINVAALGDEMVTPSPRYLCIKLFITDKGKAWAGVTLEDSKLIKLAKDFYPGYKLARWMWTGIDGLLLMADHIFMEVNPRFPAWIYLTVGAGPKSTGCTCENGIRRKNWTYTSYSVGKTFIRYSWDMIIDIEQFQHFLPHWERIK